MRCVFTVRLVADALFIFKEGSNIYLYNKNQIFERIIIMKKIISLMLCLFILSTTCLFSVTASESDSFNYRITVDIYDHYHSWNANEKTTGSIGQYLPLFTKSNSAEWCADINLNFYFKDQEEPQTQTINVLNSKSYFNREDFIYTLYVSSETKLDYVEITLGYLDKTVVSIDILDKHYNVGGLQNIDIKIEEKINSTNYYTISRDLLNESTVDFNVSKGSIKYDINGTGNKYMVGYVSWTEASFNIALNPEYRWSFTQNAFCTSGQYSTDEGINSAYTGQLFSPAHTIIEGISSLIHYKEHGEFLKRGTKGLCHGFSTAVATANKYGINTFYGKLPSLENDDAGRIINEMSATELKDTYYNFVNQFTAYDFIMFAHLTQNLYSVSLETISNIKDYQGLYDAVKDYENGGDPVIIHIVNYHSLYAIKTLSETEILVYEPGSQDLQTIELKKDADGNYCGWSYDYYSVNETNKKLSYETQSAKALYRFLDNYLDVSPSTFSMLREATDNSSQTSELLVTKSSNVEFINLSDNQIIPWTEESGDYLFWITPEDNKALSFKSQEDNSDIAVGDNNTLISAVVNSDVETEIFVDDSENSYINIDNSENMDVEISFIYANENTIKLIISGNPIEKVSAIETETGINLNGFSCGEVVLMKNGEIVSEENFDGVQGAVEVVYDQSGSDDTLVINLSGSHKHSYASEITTPATHLAYGVETFICECGDTYTEPISKLEGHTYTSQVTTPATHLAEGIETFTCECGDSYTKPVAKLSEHTYVSEITKQPTHKEEGTKTLTCACGDTYTVSVAKIPHSYSKVITAPTCTEQGYTTYTCECGDSYVADYVDANGHSYTSEITTPATHIKEGVMTYTCACGDTYTEAIAKTTEHKHIAVVTAPTCIEKGFTTYTCECGDSYVDNITGLADHTDGDGDEFCDYCDEFLGSSADNNCSHMCHKDGFMGFIWKIINFFQKLFGMNPVCECGAAHY